MVFTSHIFLFWFLSVVLLLYFGLPKSWRNTQLTVVSYVFYGWFIPDFLVLMLVSTAVDYTCGLRMGEPGSGRKRKLWLLLSICTNLGLLGYYKYANLAVDTASWFSLQAGGEALSWTEVVLPVGISFYTFQSMSYTIDVYWGQVRPVRSVLDLACYVSLFPQLVAGPIVRYRDIQEQLHDRQIGLKHISTGIYLFLIGFAKKVIVADGVAPLADQGFALESPGLIESWVAVLAYTVQIYFDFSGYSDMAIGLGLILGFRFPRNFNSPYKSQSVTEFWRRWHISLSTWLRDYLYIPLGGNRKGSSRTYFNLAATMLLGGLWHGAAWTFVLWGAYQGFWLIVERLIGRSPFGWLPAPGRLLVTFVITMFGWTIFRAESMANLGAVLSGMIGLNGVGTALVPAAAHALAPWIIGIGVGIAILLPNSWALARRFHPLLVMGVVFLALAALGRLLATNYSPFIYFQF